MRRWNGWGDDAVNVTLPEAARAYLRDLLGTPPTIADAAFEQCTATVGPSRLPDHPLVDHTAATRVLHARGQSLPDWLALRFGRIERVPDGVAFPESSGDVRDLLAFAASCKARVIPYGGGTSVVGHLTPPDGDEPVLTISMARMRKLLALDTMSRLATFEAGVMGPDLEAQLHNHGYTLGHFPQSFEYSSLGGWVVTRSSGQQSLRYGRIDDLFAGGRIETPVGTLEIPTFPASAAGIDLRRIVLGSEGRLGIVTEATVKVRPVPASESFYGCFFPTWNDAETAVRTLVHRGVDLSMIRLANAMETATTLQLAGTSTALTLLQHYIALRGCRDEACLLMIGVTGTSESARAILDDARAIIREHRGVWVGARLGNRWRHNRFAGVYLRNALWECGYAVDTVETAVDWPRVRTMMHDIEAAAHHVLDDDGGVLAYTHLSHVYSQGSSVYSTFVFPLAAEYEKNLQRWSVLKRSISEAIVRNGGTISHQHGVGLDHRPYLQAEKGALGLDAMRAVFAHFDPDMRMNPGKLC